MASVSVTSVCEEAYSWLYNEVLRPYWAFVEKWFQQCIQGPCNWWCLCCNKWFCLFVLFFVVVIGILLFLLFLVAVLVVTVVCLLAYIVCGVICVGGVILGGEDDLGDCINSRCHHGSKTDPPSGHTVDPQKPPVGALKGKGGVKFERPTIDSGRLVADLAELERVTSWKRLGRRPTAMQLKLEGVDPQVSKQWQNQFNRRLADCGCTESAVALLLTAVGFGCLVITDIIAGSSVEIGIYGASALIIGGVSGKAAGLLRSQFRLRHLLSDASVHLDALVPPKNLVCGRR